jgi:hypothetical protein
MHYHTVYEISSSNFCANCFPQLAAMIACATVVLAVVLYVIFRRHSKSKEPIGFQERFINIFCGFKDMSIYRSVVIGWLLLVAVVATFLSASIVMQSYSKWTTLFNAYKNGMCQQVEGSVTEFRPASESMNILCAVPSGNSYSAPTTYESFVVDGHRFQYSDGGFTTGFSQTSIDGGPIKEDLKVRIWFCDYSIARLDVAENDSK